MTDTPRTDYEVARWGLGEGLDAITDLCGTLERELAAVTKERGAALLRVEADGQRLIAERALLESVTKERDEARECLRNIVETWDDTNDDENKCPQDCWAYMRPNDYSELQRWRKAAGLDKDVTA